LRRKARLIFDLFKIMENDALKPMEIKTKYDHSMRRVGLSADIRSTEVTSFCAFQYAIGMLQEGRINVKIGKKPLKPQKFEKARIAKTTENFIEDNREELFSPPTECDEDGKIIHHYTPDEQVEMIFNRENRDYRQHDERKIKLALKWKPNHIIVKGKIFEISSMKNKINMTRSSTHIKPKLKFSCFFINSSDICRFEENQGNFCDVACDKITDEEKELENTLLLKIENES
jgi:hypothetical protein